MANLVRSAKSASNWATPDLRSYNISIASKSSEEFFGHPHPTIESLTDIDPHLISGTVNTQGLSDGTYRVLRDLQLASGQSPCGGLAMDDFAREILHVLGYETRTRLLWSRYDIPFHLICDRWDKVAETDVCLMNDTTIFLVVIVMKSLLDGNDPESQAIAAAIAAFQYNNRCLGTVGKPQLDYMAIPCITMLGTQPTFLKVPVTRELNNAVQLGQFPASPTVVERCVVATETFPSPNQGMESLDYRPLALQHYVAFRDLAKSCWLDSGLRTGP